MVTRDPYRAQDTCHTRGEKNKPIERALKQELKAQAVKLALPACSVPDRLGVTPSSERRRHPPGLSHRAGARRQFSRAALASLSRTIRLPDTPPRSALPRRRQGMASRRASHGSDRKGGPPFGAATRAANRVPFPGGRVSKTRRCRQ